MMITERARLRDDPTAVSFPGRRQLVVVDAERRVIVGATFVNPPVRRHTDPPAKPVAIVHRPMGTQF